MDREQVPGGDFCMYTTLANGTKRLVLRQGTRYDDKKNPTPFIITYAYPSTGGQVEHESMELCVLDEIGMPVQMSSKYVVREHPPTGTVRTISLFPTDGPRPIDVWVSIETLGYTLEGGQGEDPREPWARFTIEDPELLRLAFGQIDTSSRRPNDTGTYVVLVNTADRPLIAPVTRDLCGRTVTITEVGEITVNFGPDTVDSQPGPLLKAFFRKIKWLEGDGRIGMMA